REAKGTDNVIVTIFARIGQAAGFDLHRGSAHQESQEVHKMADFPDDAATALFRIIQPVIGRNEAGIHAVMQRQWFVSPSKKTLEPKRERSEPAVETDHEKRLANRLLVLRSEEHTSELQSRGHLVCRLLLEKKKRDIKSWNP